VIATIATMLLLVGQSAQQVAAPPAGAIVAPADWSRMPQLPWRIPPRITADLIAVVEREVADERCVHAPGPVVVDMAVLARGDGGIRAVVPRAIGCATIEQFSAGLVTSFARNNLRRHSAGWYRTTISFDRR